MLGTQSFVLLFIVNCIIGDLFLKIKLNPKVVKKKAYNFYLHCIHFDVSLIGNVKFQYEVIDGLVRSFVPYSPCLAPYQTVHCFIWTKIFQLRSTLDPDFVPV